MPTTRLFLEPADVLVFRDGRPFSAGDDHLATGPFPPPPSAVYGALRSALLVAAGADFSRDDFGLAGALADALGTKTRTGTLTLRSLSLGRPAADGGAERLWTPPLDLLRKKDRSAEGEPSPPGPAFVTLRPARLPDGVQTNLPAGLRLLLPPPHPAATFYQTAGGFLTDAGLATVLKGDRPDSDHLVQTEAVFSREPRTHVSLRGDASLRFTGTAEEGRLFTVDFVRPRPGVGLVMDVAGLPDGLDTPGLMRLGGESRPARIRALTDPAPTAAAISSVQLRLVLTTPCPCADGWRPDAVGDGSVRIDGRDYAATLVGAAVGRHETIGGWDIARRRPKPARRAAPAGSVYVLDDVADAPALAAALDGRSLCSDPADRAQGYGLVRVGAWPSDS